MSVTKYIILTGSLALAKKTDCTGSLVFAVCYGLRGVMIIIIIIIMTIFIMLSS